MVLSVTLWRSCEHFRQNRKHDDQGRKLLLLGITSTRNIGVESTHWGRQGQGWAMSAVGFEKVTPVLVKLRLTSGRADGKMTAR
jgi:hypothetical protein